MSELPHPRDVYTIDGAERAETAKFAATAAIAADASAKDPDAERHELHAAMTALLSQLARRAPAVLMLDDVQWADASSLLGRGFTDWPEAELALEHHVRSAGADEDEALLRLFAAMEGRRMHAFAGTRIGRSAANVHLPPTRPAAT